MRDEADSAEDLQREKTALAGIDSVISRMLRPQASPDQYGLRSLQ